VGKVANKKRKEIFEELKANGQLPDPPPRVKQQPTKDEIKCCLYLFANKLPSNLARCHGCPLTQEQFDAKV
jgi:hypothetical protein